MPGSNLECQYPDRPEPPLRTLRLATGSFGVSARMGRLMNLEACRSGLRVALIGPSRMRFFVPWAEIQVERRTGSYIDRAVLRFGDPEVGCLNLPAPTANRLAKAVPDCWPEIQPQADETPARAFLVIFRAWVLGAATISAMAGFFWLQGRDNSSRPPLILFVLPIVALSVVSVFSYWRRIQR
jgi:hypothetical protein